MVITFKDVSFQYTDMPLLNGIDMSITEHDKIGLIGVNGVGKSTILKLILEEINPLKGEIIKSGGIRINYLAQEPEIADNITCFAYIKSLGDKEHPVEDFEINSVLTKLKLNPEDLTTFLSGGQKRRLALAGTMVSYCDLLILDEPTNHLDSEMILYLEKFLTRFNRGLFMVTHDRYFLERCCNKMYELDNGKLHMYDANYSEFLVLKEERLEREAKEEKKIKALLKTEREWMNRGVEARRTKQKYRIERFKELSKISFREHKDFMFDSIETYLGRKIIEIKNGSKAYGDKVLFENFNLALLRTDHLGITGDNGCGKTTLFKILMQEESLDSGTIDLGETLKIGYFSQHFDDLDSDKRVIDYIMDETNEIETLDGKLSARSLLEKFLFDGHLQYSYIRSLSGGQKRRLQLVRVLAKNPNILFLDEPTNDLDIYTLEILESYLNNFKGPILCVSHDRYFLDKICDQILYYEKGKINAFNGSYSEFLNNHVVEDVKVIKQKKDKANKVFFTYNEKREFEALEKEIPILEERIGQLNESLLKEVNDYLKILAYQKELDELNEVYEEKSLRYLELLEKKENL